MFRIRFMVMIGYVLLCVQHVRAATWAAYVTGFNSDNLVVFNLNTGESQLVKQFKKGDRPTGVSIDPAGRIFISFRGGPENVSPARRSSARRHVHHDRADWRDRQVRPWLPRFS